eukprot:CAMPEP_0119325868 /NCGR_PEP_ID=MMETSP1333-20130426/66892_1 /TAXON_ID=418940 /ORGANISM="Scyphosphaera apsteinii, Strain RCC1455" /LENGTH=196 /DNA_ID=CAMNT_0007334003 /DNA_START=291 /DNA_END=882 /DNA_ORIENTATION=+
MEATTGNHVFGQTELHEWGNCNMDTCTEITKITFDPASAALVALPPPGPSSDVVPTVLKHNAVPTLPNSVEGWSAPSGWGCEALPYNAQEARENCRDMFSATCCEVCKVPYERLELRAVLPGAVSEPTADTACGTGRATLLSVWVVVEEATGTRTIKCADTAYPAHLHMPRTLYESDTARRADLLQTQEQHTYTWL